jgi:5-(carboxyamino)imidazole ribonucleotide mutase
VVAAHTPLPVIGVPIKSKALKGQDSLLSTVQMPPGVPVATVAIDGGRNAGLLAIQILATHDADLFTRLVTYKEQLAEATREKDRRLQERLRNRKR